MAPTGVYVLSVWAGEPNHAARTAYVCLAMHGVAPFAHRIHEPEQE